MQNKKEKNKKEQVEIIDVDNFTRKKKFWKYWLVIFCITLMLIVIVVKLLYIQVIDTKRYYQRAESQHQSRIELHPQRGIIYDRNGYILASNIKSVSIAVDPTVLQNKDTIAILMEKCLGISSDSILKKINSAKGSFVWLCRRKLPSEIMPLKYIKDRGLILIYEPIRYYNYSSVGSQLIGCTNIDNHGIDGIELKYDSILRGQSGFMIMYKDAKNRLRPAIDLPVLDPVNGDDLYLTLDIKLQKIVEFELMQGVISSQATSGTVIALDPNTGELLASASYPSYDPNHLTKTSYSAMRNRAITDIYEPGSTFKTITASAGIEEKIVRPNDMYSGFNGKLTIGQVTIRDDHALGITSFRSAFEKSSNVIFSQLADKLPAHRFYKYIRDFGFGLPTRIDLTGEMSGKIKDFRTIRAIDKRFLGFGYGIMVTPIQLVNAYSVIANGGNLMKPFIIKEIKRNNKTIKINQPQKIRKVISQGTAQTLTSLLCGVVENGTGKRAYIENIKVAGKTGTSQQLEEGIYSKSNYFASFVGFFPANKPKVCLLVLMDQPKNNFYGGSVAAPIFKNIALRWASASPEIMEASQSYAEKNNTNTIYMPELVGLSVDDARNIIKELRLNCNLREESTGIIVSQVPRAGTCINRNSKIILLNSITNKMTNSKQDLNDVPNVKGLPLRRAVSLMHNCGIKTKIYGSGKVKEQKIEINKKTKDKVCILICY